MPKTVRHPPIYEGADDFGQCPAEIIQECRPVFSTANFTIFSAEHNRVISVPPGSILHNTGSSVSGRGQSRDAVPLLQGQTSAYTRMQEARSRKSTQTASETLPRQVRHTQF